MDAAEKLQIWNSLPPEIWCLSTRQPWAHLLITGAKSIEDRTWQPEVALPFWLLIHASRKEEKQISELLKLTNLPLGAIVGLAKLVEVIKYTPETWEASRQKNLEDGALPEDKSTYGWVLEKPLPLKSPIPYPGQLQLFKVAKRRLTNG